MMMMIRESGKRIEGNDDEKKNCAHADERDAQRERDRGGRILEQSPKIRGHGILDLVHCSVGPEVAYVLKKVLVFRRKCDIHGLIFD